MSNIGKDEFDWFKLQQQALEYGGGHIPEFFDFLMDAAALNNEQDHPLKF